MGMEKAQEYLRNLKQGIEKDVVSLLFTMFFEMQ